MDRGTNIDAVTQCLLSDRSKDEWTHYRRVELLCAMTAKSLGWLPGEIEDLRLAALFHHVDVSLIPDSALSPRVAEFLSEISRRINDPTNEQCVTQGGKPAEAASIIMLADRFDRLTSRQRYRSALSDADAVDILWYDAEIPTDVDAIRAFCRAYRMIPRLRLAKAA